MEHLDDKDRALLRILQRGIPICSRPYQKIAEELGDTSEAEVIERIEKLKAAKIIRRMSGFFQSHKLGYRSALCAMRVPEAHVEEMAALLDRFPGITHNYLRAHEYNMWFTLISPGPEAMDEVIRQIEASGWTDHVQRFHREKQYKIHASFDLEKGVAE